MGLAHLLGLDDGQPRAFCRDCGQTVTIDQDATGDDACPDCGSTDVTRIALL